MNKRQIGLIAALGVFVLVAGGCILRTDGWWPKAKAERTVELQHPLEAGTTLAVETASGSIDVTGQDVNATYVVATITARAATEEEAQALADEVRIRFEPSSERLEIVADRPSQKNRQSVSISYQIVTPRRSHLQCKSASGSLKIADLTADVDARAASGSVTAVRIEGNVDLHSASGSVRGENVRAGDVRLDAASGSIRLADASQIGTCNLHAASGSVHAGNVEAEAIKMRSASGSVALSNARAQAVDLHSSSGRATADQIDCARLKAESISGSVSATFAPEAPGSVVAELRSGSGSIDVTVPANFAGTVDLAVGTGSIHTDLPLQVRGPVGKKHVRGLVGEGKGRLSAQTTTGSIRVR